MKILAIASLFYSIFAIFAFGFNTGTFAIIFISFLLIMYGFKLSPIMYKKIILIPVILGTVIFFTISTFLFIYSHNNNVTFEEDVVIVLGAGLKGENVSKTLKYRLDKAISYYDKNKNVVIVVSGGQGFDEVIPEALAMQNYLLKNEIPKNSIIMESNSTSTYENFVFSKEILDNHFDRDYTSCFITNDFHIYRATNLNKKASLNSNHYYAKTPISAIPVCYARETIAVSFETLKSIFNR